MLAAGHAGILLLRWVGRRIKRVFRGSKCSSQGSRGFRTIVGLTIRLKEVQAGGAAGGRQ